METNQRESVIHTVNSIGSMQDPNQQQNQQQPTVFSHRFSRIRKVTARKQAPGSNYDGLSGSPMLASAMGVRTLPHNDPSASYSATPPPAYDDTIRGYGNGTHAFWQNNGIKVHDNYVSATQTLRHLIERQLSHKQEPEEQKRGSRVFEYDNSYGSDLPAQKRETAPFTMTNSYGPWLPALEPLPHLNHLDLKHGIQTIDRTPEVMANQIPPGVYESYMQLQDEQVMGNVNGFVTSGETQPLYRVPLSGEILSVVPKQEPQEAAEVNDSEYVVGQKQSLLTPDSIPSSEDQDCVAEEDDQQEDHSFEPSHSVKETTKKRKRWNSDSGKEETSNQVLSVLPGDGTGSSKIKLRFCKVRNTAEGFREVEQTVLPDGKFEVCGRMSFPKPSTIEKLKISLKQSNLRSKDKSNTIDYTMSKLRPCAVRLARFHEEINIPLKDSNNCITMNDQSPSETEGETTITACTDPDNADNKDVTDSANENSVHAESTNDELPALNIDSSQLSNIYSCPKCKRLFQHIKHHDKGVCQDALLYTCPVCLKSFTCFKWFAEHMVEHGMNAIDGTDLVKMKKTPKLGYDKSKNIDRPNRGRFECKFCSKKFSRLWAFKAHVFRMHPQMSAKEILALKDIRAIVNEASTGKDDKEQLKETDCSIDAVHEDETSLANDQETIFECHICQEKFHRRKKLRNHLYKEHKNSLKSNWLRKFQGKMVWTEQQVENDFDASSSEGTFTVPVVPEDDKSVYAMKSQIESMDEDSSDNVEFYGQAPSQSQIDAWLQVVEQYDGSTNILCLLCQKPFLSTYYLQRHLRQVHKLNDIFSICSAIRDDALSEPEEPWVANVKPSEPMREVLLDETLVHNSTEPEEAPSPDQVRRNVYVLLSHLVDSDTLSAFLYAESSVETFVVQLLDQMGYSYCLFDDPSSDAAFGAFCRNVRTLLVVTLASELRDAVDFDRVSLAAAVDSLLKLLQIQ